MPEQKKISIIIPCYNATAYIEACIQNLEQQTIGMEHLEIILVNDASTDQTYDLLCEVEKKFPESILVINCEKNGKQGTARNIGLQYASAPYIGYMDIDDYIEPDMFEKLYGKAVFHNCEVVICRSKTHEIESLNTISMGVTGKPDQILQLMNENDRFSFIKSDINVAVWNKLYAKDFLIEHHIHFPEGFIYEDIFFTELVKQHATKVYILEEYLYHHIKWPDSTSHATNNWKSKIDWLFVEELKILELRKRNRFLTYQNYYEDEFIISYITLVYILIATYGSMNRDILVFLQDRVSRLFPHYQRIHIFQRIYQTDTGYKNLILRGFTQDINDEYLNVLIQSIQKK